MKDKEAPKWRTINVEVSPQMEDILNQLLATGLHGQTIEDTAHRLLAAELWEGVKTSASIRLRAMHGR